MERKHFMRPLKSGSRASRHLLVWMDADEGQTYLRCRGCRAWDVTADGCSIDPFCMDSYQVGLSIDAMLDGATQGKGTLTVWLARGWEDLVLSGIGALIDAGHITWRYALLDGQRVMIRGQYRGRSVVITSLANWLGRHWQHWPEAHEDAEVRRLLTAFDGRVPADGAAIEGGERQFLAAWCAIAAASAITGCSVVEPSVSAAAKQAWRRWIGPQFLVAQKAGKQCHRDTAEEHVTVVAPSPYRPDAAARAERHVCYGLAYRQLRIGLVDEPIYCLDLRCAYALALATAVLPAYYVRTLHRPTAAELAKHMGAATAQALVRLDTPEVPFPVRRNRKVFAALGKYWTWLCGTELAGALALDLVREVYKAYLWCGCTVRSEVATALLSFSDACKETHRPAVAAVWRAMYSALVGQFAARRRVWVDTPARAGFGSWCAWTRCHVGSSEIETCRAIAGRHQVLKELTDTSASVPLLYGCITSHVRWAMRILAAQAGEENVVAEVADSLWTTAAGYQRLQRQSATEGFPPDSIRNKAVYDRAWLTGGASCIVERHGIKYVHSPGCPDSAQLDRQGGYTHACAMPWHDTGPIPERRGVRRRYRRFSGAKLMERFGHAPRAVDSGVVLDDPLLSRELLEPPVYTRSVEDVQD